jgi:hypothetical protein
MAAMHQEAAGAHLPAQGFGLSYPVSLKDRLDAQSFKLLTTGRLPEQRQHCLARRRFGIMRGDLHDSLAAFERTHRHGGWCLAVFQSRGDGVSRISRNFDGCQIKDGSVLNR